MENKENIRKKRENIEKQENKETRTLGTRGYSRLGREFSVLAEGRHIFGRRPEPRAAKPREKPLA